MTRPAKALPVDGPAFDAALAASDATLLDSDGGQAVLPVRRWSEPADADDAWLLDRCTGPTVDLGCGPGRLLAALGAPRACRRWAWTTPRSRRSSAGRAAR